MRLFSFQKNIRSQTAIEYLLLFTVTAVIVFALFKSLTPRAQQVSNQYYSKVAVGIMGQPPDRFRALIPLTRGDCAWSPSCEEDDFCGGTRRCDAWNGGSRPFMCGRYHGGDENGQTRNYCCQSTPQVSPASVIEILCNDESECGAMQCPDNRPFMVGRVHFDDENGRTYYQCARVLDQGYDVYLTNCQWNPSGWTLKESSGTWFSCPADRPFLKGRWHDTGSSCGGSNGDENTCTRYLCCQSSSM